jgi:ketosteroid isomerase-like protein
MEQHPNSKLAAASWLAVSNSDVEALEKLWADDIVWHSTGRNPWAGVYVGREAVLDYLAQVGESVETYDARLDDVLVSDDRLMLVCNMRLKHAGHEELEMNELLLARIENAKIAEVWLLALDPEAVAAYWENAVKKTA